MEQRTALPGMFGVIPPAAPNNAASQARGAVPPAVVLGWVAPDRQHDFDDDAESDHRSDDGFQRRFRLYLAARHRTYPVRFKALVVLVLGVSVLWIHNYARVVAPALGQYSDDACKYHGRQLTYNARMLFVYFVWFLLARMALFLPCVVARVVRVRTQTHGFCHAYCVHLLLRDGPLYIFVLGALLFWFHLMQAPACEEQSPEFYRILKLYAIYSNSMSMFCLILAYWHNKIMGDAWDEEEHRIDRSAPPDTMSKLVTQKYCESLFGDEEGKLYPSECAICLCPWEPEDQIRVTPCEHAFHEECLGGWLRTARTCALCRRDLASSPPQQGVVRPQELGQQRLPAAPPPLRFQPASRPDPGAELRLSAPAEGVRVQGTRLVEL